MKKTKKEKVKEFYNKVKNEPICPRCGNKIEYLHYYEERGGTYEWMDGDYNFSDGNYMTDSLRFECPHCAEELFDGDEEEAKKFLKRGEKIE
jgi:predicted RNA-binding Zn-ribbon protein involved in translation (DUF1610 family)